MKKVFFLILCFCSFVFCSCMSTKVAVKDNWGPVALMSVTFNNHINWPGEENGGSGLLKLAADKGVETVDNDSVNLFLGRTVALAEDAKNTVIEVFTNELNLEVINENTLKNLPSYTDGKEDKVLALIYVAPDGYKFYTKKNKVAAEVKSIVGANSFAYVHFNVGKHMCYGIGKTGSMTGDITAIVDICDEKGKVLAHYEGYSSCFDRIACVNGIYNKQALQDMFPEVFEYALKDAFFN